MKKLNIINPKNIIVRMPNWVGDLVMATPILVDIKKAFPNANLSVLALENLCDLLKDDKNIDKLYFLKKQKSCFFKKNENKKLIEELKKKSFDFGLLLTNSFSSAYLFHKAKIKNLVGYKKDFRSFLLKYSISFNKENVHQIIKYKNLLKPLGIGISQTKPKLYYELNDLNNAKELLMKRGFKEGQTLIGINPFARFGSAKCYPLEKFKEIIKNLSNDKNKFIVLLGDKYSKELLQNFIEELPNNVVNLAGDTSLKELMCIIKLCDLFITNDSGPMHIASALKTPLIALFGSTSACLTGPYNEKDIILYKKVDCSPCFKRKCPKDFKCMTQITTTEVINKIDEILT